MKVEVLFFDGCPNHEALLPHLEGLLNAGGAGDTAIALVRVEDADTAEAKRFLGSPTVRIDGHDVEPGADERTDFGLKCRLFATPEGLQVVAPLGDVHWERGKRRPMKMPADDPRAIGVSEAIHAGDVEALARLLTEH